MIDQLRKLMEPLQRRIMLMVGRCVLNAVYDSAPTQLCQASMLTDEVRDKMERMTEYGYTSRPHPGAHGLAVFVGGERGHGIVIATGDTRYRLVALEYGEVALYDDLDQIVKLKRNGIDVETPLNVMIRSNGEGKTLRLEADRVEIHGREYLQTDVHGKGQRETWTGGTNWHTDTYTTGASGSSTEHGLDIPHIPTTHPDAD